MHSTVYFFLGIWPLFGLQSIAVARYTVLTSFQSSWFGIGAHFACEFLVNVKPSPQIHHCGNATVASDHEKWWTNASKLRNNARQDDKLAFFEHLPSGKYSQLSTFVLSEAMQLSSEYFPACCNKTMQNQLIIRLRPEPPTQVARTSHPTVRGVQRSSLLRNIKALLPLLERDCARMVLPQHALHHPKALAQQRCSSFGISQLEQNNTKRQHGRLCARMVWP